MPRSLLTSAICASLLAIGCSHADAAKHPTPPPAAASAQQTPSDEIDRVRGCWIQKVEPNGRATLLLRLLPDRERKDWLTGQLQRADGDDPDRRLRLMFSRDGQHAAMATAPIVSAPGTGHATPPVKAMPSAKARKPNADAMASLVVNPSAQVEYLRSPTTAPAATDAAAGTQVIEYQERGGGNRLRVEVSAEHLKLSVGAAGLRRPGAKTPEAVLFDGGRDGCD
jgi:hypothetical protein